MDKKGVRFAYLDITSNLKFLKDFIELREKSSEFDVIRENRFIGLPCLVDGDKIMFKEEIEKIYG